ncbi:MAG: hypothetical protein KVP17_000146 [Porospora cf. gigantea B]|uniref:uncharacterized protein n=1 Tax=Porospora cf. gigantea B TaxID=2853592 RepID=UPI003571998B|nr:MAG: hypothetical protein KVP17_000146 [Porospora cf. gigantea B]
MHIKLHPTNLDRSLPLQLVATVICAKEANGGLNFVPPPSQADRNFGEWVKPDYGKFHRAVRSDTQFRNFTGRIKVEMSNGTAKWTQSRFTGGSNPAWEIDKDVVLNNDDFILPPDIAKKYRFLTIDGMKVIMVQDPRVIDDNVAVNLPVGMVTDAEFHPGISHLAEHCLDSSKLIGESFINWCAKRGGNYNAYTSRDDMAAHFSISPEFFEKALEIFSDCLSAPNLTPELVAHELEAVENEHKRNRGSSAFQNNAAFKQILNQKARACLFNAGDKETLTTDLEKAGTTALEQVQKWHDRYLSRNLMCVAIVSNRPLAEQQALVEKHFAKIPNKGTQVQTRLEDVQKAPILAEDSVGRFVKSSIPGSIPSVSFILPVEAISLGGLRHDTALFYRAFDVTVMAEKIREMGLGSHFLCHASEYGNTRFLEFSVVLSEQGATPEGLDAIGDLIARRLWFVKCQPLYNDTPQRLGEQYERDFLYEGSDTASSAVHYASTLRTYGPEVCAGLSDVTPLSNLEDMKTFIAELDMSNVILFTRGAPWDAECTELHPKFHYKWKIDRIPREWVRKWAAVANGPVVPARQPTSEPSGVAALRPGTRAPTDPNLDLPKVMDVAEHCYCIYKKDNWYGDRTAQCSTVLHMVPPEAVEAGKKLRVLLLLFCCLVNDEVDKLTPLGMFRDTHVWIHPSSYLELTVGCSGHPDKIAARLELLWNLLREPLNYISERNFHRIKQTLVEAQRSIGNDQGPSQLVCNLRGRVVNPDRIGIGELAKLLEAVTWPEFEARFREGLPPTACVAGTAMGNLTEAEARAFLLRSANQPLSGPAKAIKTRRLDNDDFLFLVVAPGKAQEHHCVSISIVDRNVDEHHTALGSLYSAWANKCIFEQLREKEDLAYETSVAFHVFRGHTALEAHIQSPKNANALLDRLQRFIRELQPPSEEEFDNLVKGMRHRLVVRPESVHADFGECCRLFYQQKTEHMSTRKHLAALDSLTLQDLKDFISSRSQQKQTGIVGSPIEKCSELKEVEFRAAQKIYLRDLHNEEAIRRNAEELGIESSINETLEYLQAFPGFDYIDKHADVTTQHPHEYAAELEKLKTMNESVKNE